TPQYLAPTYADAFAETRAALGLAPTPLAVVVTGSGNLKVPHPILSGATPALVVTTPRGRAALPPLPDAVRVAVVPTDGRIAPAAILDAARAVAPIATVLLEGGPGLVSDFLADRLLDELFLTIAPQVVGRIVGVDRPGLALGHLFAPNDPRWATLRSVHRAGDHLFLRYAFPRA
ncbi:MAG: dihydrofolate reductase family protein, partial [Dehalococcoidia bacterium]|nr:dihydrofolate reductase family protein [Dehalococcoidia bacterium]